MKFHPALESSGFIVRYEQFGFDSHLIMLPNWC